MSQVRENSSSTHLHNAQLNSLSSSHAHMARISPNSNPREGNEVIVGVHFIMHSQLQQQGIGWELSENAQDRVIFPYVKH